MKPIKQSDGRTMKATVNRQLFIEHISPIPTDSGVSILIADGILSAASFGHGITAKMPAYVLKNGHFFWVVMNAIAWYLW